MIRRIQDYMESSGDRIVMLFLDWEKAFDKIDHEELIKAIERFNIPEKIVRILKAFYDNPKFFIEDNMGSSKEKKTKHWDQTGMPPLTIFVRSRYDSTDARRT